MAASPTTTLNQPPDDEAAERHLLLEVQRPRRYCFSSLADTRTTASSNKSDIPAQLDRFCHRAVFPTVDSSKISFSLGNSLELLLQAFRLIHTEALGIEEKGHNFLEGNTRSCGVREERRVIIEGVLWGKL